MRKRIVLSMITLDGVMQAPGGQKAERSNGFKYGDEVYNQVVQNELKPAGYRLRINRFLCAY